jgi:hypothetical protein
MGQIVTYSLWTMGGAALGWVFCLLFAETSAIEAYMVGGAILGFIARFLIMEL